MRSVHTTEVSHTDRLSSVNKMFIIYVIWRKQEQFGRGLSLGIREYYFLITLDSRRHFENCTGGRLGSTILAPL